MAFDRKFEPKMQDGIIPFHPRSVPGCFNEERLYKYLKTKYPQLLIQFGSRKDVYDIYTTYADFDAVGVDRHYRLILDHKDIHKHREHSRCAGKPGFIAFMFPKDSGYWFFLPVSSKIITKSCGRPVIDGYVLSACVSDPIYAGLTKISKADWFKNTVEAIYNIRNVYNI